MLFKKKKKLSQKVYRSIEEKLPKLKETKQEFINIEAEPSNNLRLWESKFGGYPYMPRDFNYPRDNKDNPLLMIAQFDLTTVPRIKCLDLPRKGILQFFISSEPHLGLNFKNSAYDVNLNIGSDTVRVIYHEKIIKNQNNIVTDFSFLPKGMRSPIRRNQEFKLDFSIETGYMSSFDYRFDSIMGDNFLELIDYDIDIDILYDNYNVGIGGHGHKLGGYPTFIQWDPRGLLDKSEEPFELLFQMDSQPSFSWGHNWDICWGDVGVANYFIKLSDLKNLNFTNVLYNWDCS